MSMTDILKKLNSGSFDPNKGKIKDETSIPDGTYNVSMSQVTHGMWKNSNTDYIRFDMTILDGKEAGRVEFITPTLAQKTSKGNPMPDFVLNRSIQTIKIIGAMVGYQVSDDPFITAITNETQAYEDLKNGFLPYVGKTLQMTIKNTPNKKNPDHPYRNYDFAKLEQPKVADVDDKQDPFADQKDGIELTDNDLPFDK